MKKNFENKNFCIDTNHVRITSDLIFINKFLSQIDWLKVDAYYLRSYDMKNIINTLSNSNTKVRFVAFYLLTNKIMLFDSEKLTNKKLLKKNFVKSLY